MRRWEWKGNCDNSFLLCNINKTILFQNYHSWFDKNDSFQWMCHHTWYDTIYHKHHIVLLVDYLDNFCCRYYKAILNCWEGWALFRIISNLRYGLLRPAALEGRSIPKDFWIFLYILKKKWRIELMFRRMQAYLFVVFISSQTYLYLLRIKN